MNVSGLAVGVDPARMESIRAEITALGWAEVHAHTPEGRMVVVLEGADTREVTERLKQLQELPGVLSAQVVMHVFEDDPDFTPRPDDPNAGLEYLNAEGEMAPGGHNHYQSLKRQSNF